MAVEVALAMLQRHGRWLMQLRGEIPAIVAPAAGSSPWCITSTGAWSMCSALSCRFHWSSRLQEHRPLADGLLEVMREVLVGPA